jgi:hypothetical protein
MRLRLKQASQGAEQVAAVVDLLNSRHVSIACAKSISLVGRCEYERSAASCKSVGNREGFPINQLDVENGAIDDFLLDQGKGRSSSHGRPDHYTTCLDQQVFEHQRLYGLVFYDENAATLQ